MGVAAAFVEIVPGVPGILNGGATGWWVKEKKNTLMHSEMGWRAGQTFSLHDRLWLWVGNGSLRS